MTYDQYQQLYSAAKEQIAARVAQVQPTAGNGASVNGMGIAVEVPVADEAAEEEDWNFVLLADITYTVIRSESSQSPGGTKTFTYKRAIAYVTRDSTILALPFAFLDDNVIVFDDGLSKETVYVSANITFRSSSIPANSSSFFGNYYDLNNLESSYEPYSWQKKEERIFRFPVRVGIDVFKGTTTGVGDVNLVESHNFRVGFSGKTVNFVPPSEGIFFLTVKSIQRVD